MREVVVAGNVGIDTNVYLPQGFDPADLEVHEATFTTNVDGVGQAGGYASIAHARLGRATAFIGYVGDDPLGRWIESTLWEVGVDAHLFIDPAGTSRSINLMKADGTRNNFYDGKSHLSLSPEPARVRGVLSGARLLHLHIPHWGRQLIPVARELGVVVACDLQDVRDVDDPYRQDFIEGSDILFCSTVDAAAPDELAEALGERNPRATIVLGHGARGAGLWTAGDGYRAFPPVEMPEPVIDTNGAGDSLAAGFLLGHVLEGRPLDEAIRWGQTAARYACTLPGHASTGLITRPELDRRLA